MSSELVGFENLPNAFIKQIEIFDRSQKEIQIKTTICVHERKDDPMWYGTENILTKLLRIGVVFSTNKEVIGQIDAGDLSPLSTEYLQKSLSKSSTEQDNMIFEASFTMVVPKDIVNLKVYSFCFVDNKELLESFGFSLPEAYYGPIKSENVIENSSVVEDTTAFLRGNGEYWPGPVHQHLGGFMIGSYHTDRPHESLTKVTLPNSKIKDFRKNTKKQNQTKKGAINFISELMVSYSSDTDINALFMLNMKTLLKNNTKFGAFLDRASTEIVSQLVDSFTIKMLTIQRQRVKLQNHGSKNQQVQTIFSKKNIIKTNDDPNTIRNTTRLERNGSFDVVVSDLRSNTEGVDRKEGEIFSEELPDYEKISMIKELFFDYDSNIRTFQFNDYQLTDTTPGTYLYKMDLQLTDPVYPFLVGIVDVFKQLVGEIKRYVSFVSRGRVSSENSELVQTLVSTYVMYYSYIYEISSKEKNDLSAQMFGLLNPSTVSLVSASQFQGMFEELYAEFLFFLDFDPTSTYSNKEKVSIMSKNQTTARILVSKTFKKPIQPSSNSVGFGYMGPAVSPEMKVMTKRLLQEKASEQTNNHFNDQPTLNSPDLDESTNTGLNDINTHSATYWSPTMLKATAQKITMGRDSKAPYGLLNKTLGARAPQQSTFKQQAKKDQTGVSVQPPSVPAQPQEENSESPFIESSEIMGTGQEFVTYSEVASSYNVFETQTAANEKFDNFYSGFQNNRTFDVVLEDTKKLSAAEAQELPNQLKAIIHGQSTVTNTNYISSGTDLLSNPTTKNYYEVNNFSVQKLIYIDRFKVDKNENVLLHQPVFKEMSQENLNEISKPVICFLQPYTNDKFKITDEKKTSVVDSFFILSDRDLTVRSQSPSTEEVPIYNVQDVSYEFMNSNIVIQTNAPMTEQTQQATDETTVVQDNQSFTPGLY